MADPFCVNRPPFIAKLLTLVLPLRFKLPVPLSVSGALKVAAPATVNAPALRLKGASLSSTPTFCIPVVNVTPTAEGGMYILSDAEGTTPALQLAAFAQSVLEPPKPLQYSLTALELALTDRTSEPDVPVP